MLSHLLASGLRSEGSDVEEAVSIIEARLLPQEVDSVGRLRYEEVEEAR